jgi:DNA polymerase-3 subunit delta'
MTIPTSNQNFSNIIGYDTIIKDFTESLENNKTHHAWLFSGKRGVGKATLCYHLANLALDSPTSIIKIKTASHPDLLAISLAEDAKEIKVDDARKINSFLRMTAAESQYKIVLIDAVDEMNLTAANSILKLLEEPPHNCLFLLVAHNPEKLLATIKSRCKVIRMPELKKDNATAIIKSFETNITNEELNSLIDFFAFSPGKALEFFKNGGLDIYKDILKSSAKHNNLAKVGQELNSKYKFSLAQLDCFTIILNHMLQSTIKCLATNDFTFTDPSAEEFSQIIASNNSLEKILEFLPYLNEFTDKTKRLNLDKNHFMMNCFNKIA